MTAYELRYHQTGDGKQPFTAWLEQLVDAQARAKIQVRLARLASGNFGDHKGVGDGVMELRIDWGPGYRVYLARVGRTVVLLLCGGDKATQQEDIARAKTYLANYKTRTAPPVKARARGPRRRA